MSIENIYTVTPRQLRQNLMHLLDRGRVPFIRGQPGVGKSSIVAALAKEANLELVDIRLPMYDPTDFSGFPFDMGNGRSSFLPTDLFPIVGDPLPKGKNGWLVLLDEFPQASKEMIRASYKLLLDGYVGSSKVHEDVYFVLAGNRIEDNALVEDDIGTAAGSRVTHLNLISNHKEWMEDVAIPRKFDYRIIGFLSEYPNKLNDFDPEVTEASFCCNRTWDFMNDIVNGVDNLDPIMASVVGTISPGVAFEFIQYCKIYKSLPTMAQIITDPDSCSVPADSSGKWAAATRAVQHTTGNNLEQILKYIWKLSIEHKIIYCRMVLASFPELADHPAMTPKYADVGKYLHD